MTVALLKCCSNLHVRVKVQLSFNYNHKNTALAERKSIKTKEQINETRICTVYWKLIIAD